MHDILLERGPFGGFVTVKYLLGLELRVLSEYITLEMGWGGHVGKDVVTPAHSLIRVGTGGSSDKTIFTD